MTPATGKNHAVFRRVTDIILVVMAAMLPLAIYMAANYSTFGRTLNKAAQDEFIGTGFDSYDTQALIFLVAPGLIPLMFLSFSEIVKGLMALAYTLGLTAYIGFIYLGWPLHPGKTIDPLDAAFNPRAFSFEDYPMSGQLNHYGLYFALREILKPGMTEQDVDDILVASGDAAKTCGTADAECHYDYKPLAARYALEKSAPSDNYRVYVYYDTERYLTDFTIRRE